LLKLKRQAEIAAPAEHAFDRNYAAEKLGVDIENLIISQPDNGNKYLKLLKT
jgi:RecA/RadA recombinase